MRNFLIAGAMSLAFLGSISAIGQQAAPDDKKDVKPPDNAVRLGPRLMSFDLNPVMAGADRAVVVDARIALGPG